MDKLINDYYMVVNPYPHIILRENKMIFGAHADRLQQGMRRSFGTAIGTAAKVEVDQTLITVKVKAGQEETAKESLKRGSAKLPIPCKIVISKIVAPPTIAEASTDEAPEWRRRRLDRKRERTSFYGLIDLRNNDVSIVGGKNASLGEMISAGLPVPPGFAVTAYSYEKFIQEKKIAEKIYKIIKETITNPNDPKQYDTASKRIRELIEKTPMPKDMEKP